MLELQKTIAAFILPPGLFIVILGVAAIMSWRRRRKGFALFNLLTALALWGISIVPTQQMLMSSLEKGLGIPDPLRGDVILLLGGGIHQGVPDLTGKGTPSNEMNSRILTAVRAYRQLRAPIIVSGGAVFSGRAPEASTVKRLLVDLGVPENRVILEDQSRDTLENARYCGEIIAQRGFRQPLLVTSAYHMRRSIEAFRKAGLHPVPLPAQFHTGSDLPAIWADYLPNSGSFSTSCSALKEHLGLLFYKLTSYYHSRS